MGVVYERERESEEAGETLRMDLLYQQEREFDRATLSLSKDLLKSPVP